MDEARDHFLAGAGLSRDEDRRVGRRDLGGVGERLFPKHRSADRAVGAKSVELPLQHRDPLLQRPRPRGGFARTSGRPLDAFLHQAQRHAVGESFRDGHVFLGEMVGDTRHEQDGANQILPLTDRNPQLRAQSRCRDRPEFGIVDHDILIKVVVPACEMLSYQVLRVIEHLDVPHPEGARLAEAFELARHELRRGLDRYSMSSVDNAVNVPAARVRHDHPDAVVIDDALGETGHGDGDVVDVVERLELG
jgi:hypothetical protein